MTGTSIFITATTAAASAATGQYSLLTTDPVIPVHELPNSFFYMHDVATSATATVDAGTCHC